LKAYKYREIIKERPEKRVQKEKPERETRKRNQKEKPERERPEIFISGLFLLFKSVLKRPARV